MGYDGNVFILIAVMISQVYAYVKTHQIVCFKYVYLLHNNYTSIKLLKTLVGTRDQITKWPYSPVLFSEPQFQSVGYDNFDNMETSVFYSTGNECRREVLGTEDGAVTLSGKVTNPFLRHRVSVEAD